MFGLVRSISRKTQTRLNRLVLCIVRCEVLMRTVYSCNGHPPQEATFNFPFDCCKHLHRCNIRFKSVWCTWKRQICFFEKILNFHFIFYGKWLFCAMYHHDDYYCHGIPWIKKPLKRCEWNWSEWLASTLNILCWLSFRMNYSGNAIVCRTFRTRFQLMNTNAVFVSRGWNAVLNPHSRFDIEIDSEQSWTTLSGRATTNDHISSELEHRKPCWTPCSPQAFI